MVIKKTCNDYYAFTGPSGRTIPAKILGDFRSGYSVEYTPTEVGELMYFMFLLSDFQIMRMS